MTDNDSTPPDERLIIGGRYYVRSDMSGLDWTLFRQLQQVRPHVLRHMLERDDRRDKALKMVAETMASRLKASTAIMLIPWLDPMGSITGQWEPPTLPMNLPHLTARP